MMTRFLKAPAMKHNSNDQDYDTEANEEGNELITMTLIMTNMTMMVIIKMITMITMTMTLYHQDIEDNDYDDL